MRNMSKILVFTFMAIALVALSLGSACTQQAQIASPSPTPTVKPAPAPTTAAPAPTTATPTAAPKPTQAAPVVSIKANSFEPSNAERSKIFAEFLKALNTNSKGQIATEYLGGPEVIGATEIPSAIRKGTVQMATAGGSHVASIVKEVSLLALSRIPSAEERKVGAMDYLDQIARKVGIHIVGRLDPKQGENFYVYLMKKLNTPDDFKTLKGFAANGTYVQAMAKALGASFTVIKMEDAYTGLDRGTFDAYSTAIGLGVTLGIMDVCKFVLDHPIYRSNTTIIMNADVYDKLPAELKKVIDDTYLEFEPKLIAACEKEIGEGKQKFMDRKVQFIKFSAADEAKYMNISYSSESEAQLKAVPDTGTAYLKMVKAIN